jgi:hypothetical protein
MYKCECGREFDKQSSLNSHARFCKFYVKKGKTSIYIKNDHYECECGKIFEKSQGLNAHFSFCLIHRKNTPSKNRCRINPAKGIMQGWGKFTNENIKSFHKQSGATLAQNIKNGVTLPGMMGKHLSIEHREKISKIQSLNNKGGKCKFYDYIRKDGSISRVQGTWELKFAKYLDEIDANWIKIGIGHKGHTYKWTDENGKIHHYTPDFWCPELKKYYEVKGYFREEARNKMETVTQIYNLNIEIVNESRLKELKLL